jgi:hypothetical protein
VTGVELLRGVPCLLREGRRLISRALVSWLPEPMKLQIYFAAGVEVSEETFACCRTGEQPDRACLHCSGPRGDWFVAAVEPSPYDPLPKEVVTDECDR